MHNPIHQYLDAVGLPWRSLRAALAKKYGVRPHPAYGWNVIEVPTVQPLVNGLLWPLSVQVQPQFSTDMPATDFSGEASSTDDARQNLRRTVDQLSPALGAGMATGSSNTVGHEWRVGAAAVVLHAWPRELQRFPLTNPSHDREPRLKTACSIQIKTGFRPTASAAERALLESFEPIVRIPGMQGAPTLPPDRPAEQAELEFVRLPEEPFARCHGWIGCPADRSALIVYERELFLIPLASIIELSVLRTLPAKGSGGSSLYLECRCPHAGQKTKSLRICGAAGADDLNDLAATVAQAIGKPLLLRPYDYDC
jgi:hypothetical protein